MSNLQRAEEIRDWEARMAEDARREDEHEDMAAETRSERTERERQQ